MVVMLDSPTPRLSPARATRGTPLQHVSLAAAALLAAFAAASTVVGVVRDWTPLPYWDMWNGYLGFWYRLADGDTSAWWAQHNEHRIVLARALFWVDLEVFHGAGWFLVVCNLLALAAIAALVVCALVLRLRETGPRTSSRYGGLLVGCVLVAVVAAWTQNQNLLWGFQIQFFLATLLPLAGFVLIGIGANRRRDGARASRWWYVAGAGLSLASVGTIAAGVFVPFVATVLLRLLRGDRRAVAALACAALLGTALYLHGYQTPTAQPSPLTSMLTQPWGAVRYTATYLGSPAALATGSVALAWPAGLGYLVLLVALGRTALRSRTGIGLAMLAFASYVAVTGVATAAGRLSYGTDQALVGRYQTPVLVAWACLAVIAAPRLLVLLGRGSRLTVAAALAVPVLLLPQQLQALADPVVNQDRQEAATLAIALGVPDPQTLAATYAEPTLPVRLGRRAAADGLTVLGRPPYRQLRGQLGSVLRPAGEVACRGAVDTVGAVAGTPFLRVSGWLSSPPLLGGRPQVLALVDGGRRVVGFATVQHAGAAHDAVAFLGYVRAAHLPGPVTLVAGGTTCGGPLAGPRTG